MKKLTKFTALILCAAFLFASCGKNEQGQEETAGEQPPAEESASIPIAGEGEHTPVTDGKVTLPYNPADGLNPFFAVSYENQFICALLYEPLYKTESDFSITPVIAESISYSGKTATVKLKSSVECRGSSPITAQDVVYSFNLAKASYAFAGYLASVEKAEASGSSVKFTLSFEDKSAAGKLIFPIVKSGTADSRDAVPTGSGDYYYSEWELVSSDGKKTVQLYEINTGESAQNAFKIGLSDIYFSDLSDCEYSQTGGTAQSVMLNNMVYLGVNANNGALNKYVRCAMAVCIDSADIALSSYQGHAEAAKIPVNPADGLFEKIEKVAAEGDAEEAVRILDNCGYTRFSGSARTNGAYTLSFSLIVNGSNKYRLAAAYNIADTLKKAGIAVSVQALSDEDYSERISSGNFELYLGEVKLDSTHDLYSFFTEGGQLFAGLNTDLKSVSAYFEYRAGKITAEKYFEIFAGEYPFIPICFRSGYCVSSADITPSPAALPYSLYYGL